jgi:hypothetical protein
MGASGAARAAWAAHWKEAPLASLLPWAAQMLSLLDAAEGAPLLPTLQVPCPAFQSMLHLFSWCCKLLPTLLVPPCAACLSCMQGCREQAHVQVLHACQAVLDSAQVYMQRTCMHQHSPDA